MDGNLNVCSNSRTSEDTQDKTAFMDAYKWIQKCLRNVDEQHSLRESN